MAEIRVLSVFGTRPEAIKMAPLAIELGRREGIKSQICVTAQHREMLDGVLAVFGLRPGQTLADITSRVLSGLAAVFESA